MIRLIKPHFRTNDTFRNPEFLLLPATTYSTLNLLGRKVEGLSTMQRVGEATVKVWYDWYVIAIYLSKPHTHLSHDC